MKKCRIWKMLETQVEWILENWEMLKDRVVPLCFNLLAMSTRNFTPIFMFIWWKCVIIPMITYDHELAQENAAQVRTRAHSPMYKYKHAPTRSHRAKHITCIGTPSHAHPQARTNEREPKHSREHAVHASPPHAYTHAHARTCCLCASACACVCERVH